MRRLKGIGIAASLLILAGCGGGGEDVAEPEALPEQVEAQADPFGDAVNKAMAAGEGAQTAKTADEWGAVATLWGEAIELMKAVPESSENYQVAQQKATEYGPNLEYAQQNELAASKVSDRLVQPQRFHGQPLAATVQNLGATLAESGDRFTVEDETAKFYAESRDGNTISYVELGIKSLGPCQVDQAISLSEKMMALGGVPADSKTRTTEVSGFTVYSVGQLTVKTSCLFEGDWYTISVSDSE